MEGLKFLKKEYGLHTSDEVSASSKRAEIRTGDEVSQNPEEQIQNYLDRFQEIVTRTDTKEKKRGISALKKNLHRKYIIDHVPQAHLELQRRIAREAGQGANLPEEFSAQQIDEYLDIIQKDQKQSLNLWIDYLSSNDAIYPDWAKYWAFRSITTMSAYDKEKREFGIRTSNTVAPFPDLNREAFAYAVDVITKLHSPELIQVEEKVREQRNKLKKAKSALRQAKDDIYIQEAYEREQSLLTELEAERDVILPNNPVQNGENQFAAEGKLVSDEDYDKLLSTKNFAKYYAFAIEHVIADNSELFKITDGEWRIFKQGSSGLDLAKTLQGHGTGWCTAGESTASTQLDQGDFHVYYSKNSLGEAKIPRLAIRMEGQQIVEVRGVAHKQEIDPYIATIIEERMGEFGEQGEVYKAKAANMRKLTALDKKINHNEILTADELRFLWEIDYEITGFGYDDGEGQPSKDPRIEKIRKNRNYETDLITIFCNGKETTVINFSEYSTAEVSVVARTTAEITPYTKLFIGDIELSDGLNVDSLEYTSGEVILNGAKLSDNIAQMLIRTKRTKFLADNLSYFSELSFQTANHLNNFLKDSYYSVIENLESFDENTFDKLAADLLELNLTSFTYLKDQLAQYGEKPLPVWMKSVCLSYDKYLQNPSSTALDYLHDLNNDDAALLIAKGQAKLVSEQIRKFSPEFHDSIAQQLIEAASEMNISLAEMFHFPPNHLWTSGFDSMKELSYNTAKILVENGFGDKLDSIDRFRAQDRAKIILLVLETLNEIPSWIKFSFNYSKFELWNESGLRSSLLLPLEVVDSLLEKGQEGAQLVAKYPHHFVISKGDLAKKLVSAGYSFKVS